MMTMSMRNLSLVSSFSFSTSTLNSVPTNKQSQMPTMPKKPNTPWMNFYSKNFPLVKDAFPNLPTSDIMKRVSLEWKKIPEAKKSQLKSLYMKEKDKFTKLMEKVPEEMLTKQKKEKADKKMSKDKLMLEKQLKELLEKLEKPSRPPSGYILFCSERRKTMSEEDRSSIVQATKKMAGEWNVMDSTQRAYFVKRAETLKGEYQGAMEVWSKKVAEGGHMEHIHELQQKVDNIKKAAKM